MKKISVLANALGVMVLLGLLAAVAVISVGPWYYFGIGQSPRLSIGYVQTNLDMDFTRNSIYLSVASAVEDINKSVKTLSPKPPHVDLKSEPTIAKAEEQFKIMFKRDDVRVFMVTSEADALLLQKVHFGPSMMSQGNQIVVFLASVGAFHLERPLKFLFIVFTCEMPKQNLGVFLWGLFLGHH